MATITTTAKAAPAPKKATQKIAPVQDAAKKKTQPIPAPAAPAKKATQRIEAVKPSAPAPAPKTDAKKATQKIAPAAPAKPEAAKPASKPAAKYTPAPHKGFVDEGEIFRCVNLWNVANGIPVVSETGTDGLPNWTWEFDPKAFPGGMAFSVVETDQKSYNEGEWKAFAVGKGLPVLLGCRTCRRVFGGVMCD